MRKIMADSHADTIQFGLDNNIKINSQKLSFNTIDVIEYLPYIQCLACFVHDKYEDNGYKRVNEILDFYYNQTKDNNGITTVKSSNDIEKIILNNKLGILLTVENGLALEENLNNLYELYNRGIRLMTITWNGDNHLGCGAYTNFDTGLTSFGKKCVKVMNDISMIIDVSHASPKTFWDVLNYTTKPIIVSHSNAYKLCKNKRNLTDIQIKEIAKSNGMIGVTYCNDFLTKNRDVSIQNIINHISYIADLVGIEYVCLGSDFDGVNKNQLPQKLKGIKDIKNVEESMLYNKFSKEDIRKVMGQNLVTFIKNNI